MEIAQWIKDALPNPEFYVFAEGIVYASVCTDITDHAELERRMNAERPLRNFVWRVSADPYFITGGLPNGGPCQDNPETHKHFLFEC